MNMKEHILAALREQFNNWEELLMSLKEEQITAPAFDLGWSIKDVMAHLWGWQQISIARLESGVLQHEPTFPSWITQLGRNWEDDADATNHLFYEMNHQKSWSDIHQSWKEGFLRFLDSGNKISERDLLDGDRYPWLNGYSLAASLIASYEHHQEHLEKLQHWLEKDPG